MSLSPSTPRQLSRLCRWRLPVFMGCYLRYFPRPRGVPNIVLQVNIRTELLHQDAHCLEMAISCGTMKGGGTSMALHGNGCSELLLRCCQKQGHISRIVHHVRHRAEFLDQDANSFRIAIGRGQMQGGASVIVNLVHGSAEFFHKHACNVRVPQRCGHMQRNGTIIALHVAR